MRIILRPLLLLLGFMPLTALGGSPISAIAANAELLARRQLSGYRILASGETSYEAALHAAYGSHADSALIYARSYRKTLNLPGYFTRLDPDTVRRSMRIVVHPRAGATGFHGWADRQSGTIVIGHPGGNLGADSLFWATIIHESSHAAQIEQEPSEARGLLNSVSTNLLRNRSDTAEFDRYLLQPDEIEVRLMDLARYHFTRTGRIMLTPVDAASALISLGVTPWKKGMRPLLQQQTPGPDPLFPDASSLAVLCRRLADQPNSLPHIAEWLEALCVLAPGLP
jgi:hypothetical protein